MKKVTDWYFSRKALPHWGVYFLDSLIVAFSVLVAHFIDEGATFMIQQYRPILWGLLITVVLFGFGFRAFRTYSGIVRYSSFVDLQRVAGATFIGSALALIASLLLADVPQVLLASPRGVLALFAISTFLMWVERVCVKRLFDSFHMDEAVSVAIYGTKAGGISLANSITSVKVKKYRLKAFISDGQEMKNTVLMGKKVYLNGQGIAAEMKMLGVDTLLVSPLKSELFRENTAMVDEFIAAGIHIMMMPAAQTWDGKSDLTPSHLHEVEIEDLLPRDKIEVDMNAIGVLLEGKKILITGAAGSIGSEMVRQVARFEPAEMVLIDQAETPMHDIRLMMSKEFPQIKNWTIVTSIANQPHMERIFAEHCPDYVFHAAAYKHVPMMEDNPAIAVQNNIYGTRVIADLAVKYGTKKFVMISTDKAVNPTNVMGCSKRICEIYVQSLAKKLQKEGGHATQFITTRFGNVLGSNGSVIPRFRDQIQRGGPVTVTHPEIIRYFMTIPEACRLVLEAGSMGNGGEIYIFDMGKPVKIVDLAKRMISLSGRTDVKIEFTGLRHGEKLYEELLNVKELTKPTYHEKIMIATVREYDYDEVKERIQKLIDVSYTYDQMKIVAAMKDIVPEFVSKNSCFEALDKKK